jgi:hypothetical protein
MRRTSPKGKDLRRDARFAIHCSVADEDGGKGEFSVRGRASVVVDDDLRGRIASRAGYDVLPDDLLFEFRLSEARSVVYGPSGDSQAWRDE